MPRFPPRMIDSPAPQAAALDLLSRYYCAFNDGDQTGMLALLTDDVVHDANQGERENGRAAFGDFLIRMERCYSEQLVDLVLGADETGTRAAAEFTVLGKYQSTADGLPPAIGQTYALPAGAFFFIRGGQIARVTMYYNLSDWLRQIRT